MRRIKDPTIEEQLRNLKFSLELDIKELRDVIENGAKRCAFCERIIWGSSRSIYIVKDRGKEKIYYGELDYYNAGESKPIKEIYEICEWCRSIHPTLQQKLLKLARERKEDLRKTKE